MQARLVGAGPGLNVGDEDAAAGLGVPALHDHDAEALVLSLVDVHLSQALVLALVPLHRAVLVGVGWKLREGPDRQLVDRTVCPPQNESDVGLREVLDQRRDVQMVPAVDDVAVHLQNGVANLDPAVPKGVALRVEAADLDAHLGPVLVSREADAEAAGTLVDADVDERATKPAVLSLDLVSSVPVVVLVFAVVATSRDVGCGVSVDLENKPSSTKIDFLTTLKTCDISVGIIYYTLYDFAKRISLMSV